MPPNRKDIAKRTGLSLSTVGMVLSGFGSRYSEETRAKVLQAAEDLNYTPNFAGRSLRLKRSFLVGIMLHAANWHLTSEVLRGVQQVVMRSDYSPIVFFHTNMNEQNHLLKRCLDRHVDGLIVNPALHHDGTIDIAPFEQLRRRKLPMVEVFGRFLEGTPSINVDNQKSGRDAVQHLVDLGHRRIALFTHSHYDSAAARGIGRHGDAWQQYLGYSEGMTAAGFEPVVITHPLSGEVDVAHEFVAGGKAGLQSILSHPAQPTAVICYTDYEAFGLIRAARLMNMELPQDLSIIGHGNMDLSEIVTPQLTTLRMPSYEVGRQALTSLLAMFEGAQCQSAIVDAELIVRGSTGPAAKSRRKARSTARRKSPHAESLNKSQ